MLDTSFQTTKHGIGTTAFRMGGVNMMHCGACPGHQPVHRVAKYLLFALLAVHGASVDGQERPRIESPHLPTAQDETKPTSEDNIPLLIARLDASRFDSRDQATRDLVAQGPAAIPYLVDALGEESSELRLRASMLLSQHSSFEEVAIPLLEALRRPYGPRARTILQGRAVQQVDLACESPQTEKLLKFWSTDVEAFRNRLLTRFADATTPEDVEQAVEPLLGLCDKTDRFAKAVSSLETLSLSYDHQYSPGFVVAHTLARGLGGGPARLTLFAERYLESFERLGSELQRRDTSKHAIRKEISDRANMTQGAAGYLVQMLDEESPRRAVLDQQLGIRAEDLHETFFRGIASPDHEVYDRGVGRVHIIDMLTEALGDLPDLPREGLMTELIESAKQTAIDGNKPKALAFLDVLEAFRELPEHELDMHKGLGQRLARRLYSAAVQAPSNRAYHPARIVHNKIVALNDLGVGPGHAVFPNKVFDDYLRGDGRATSDDQRLALGRYLRILETLRKAGLELDRAGIDQFVTAMREGLTERQDLLAKGIGQLEPLLSANRVQGSGVNTEAISQALAQWTIEALAE